MLALRGVSRTCPGSLAQCWALGEINAKTPSPASLEPFLRWCHAFICERWRQVWGWWVVSVLEERRKAGRSQPQFGPLLCKSNHPEPSQGGWWFSHRRDEKQKTGRAQGYPTSEWLSWLLSQSLTPEPILLQYSAGFSRKEARRGHRSKPLPTPHPCSTAVHPICPAFRPFPDLSSNYHHFLQLSQVILVLAESCITSSGSSSEGKQFGTACASFQVLRASMIHASCRGNFMQTERWGPGMTGWAVFSWMYNY